MQVGATDGLVDFSRLSQTDPAAIVRAWQIEGEQCLEFAAIVPLSSIGILDTSLSVDRDCGVFPNLLLMTEVGFRHHDAATKFVSRKTSLAEQQC